MSGFVVMPLFKKLFRFLIVVSWLQTSLAFSGTLTMQTNIVGLTPEIVGYNSGHFDTNSNTGDWWHYSGVTGARLFISPTQIEPSDELPPWGDGVTNQSSFVAREALVRSDPWNTNYFNWTYVTNRYATYLLSGSDSIIVDYACSQWRKYGIQVLVQCTATASKFTNMTSWSDKWELWHFFYEQAFFLGSQYNVARYQMYNEPNAVSPTIADYVARLQTASDATQAAIADVNAMYGKSLTAKMYAPVTAGSATSAYTTWGEEVVTNRHVNFLGQTNADFSLIQEYDYHQYGGSPPNPASFGTGLASLETDLSNTMSPEPAYPVSISEFNVYDGSEFNDLTTTLDTPLNYSALGSIAVDLIKNSIDELYCFKISQTVGSGYPAKNGTHYVDNTDKPYNIGGITNGGEVWRLINKALAPGRSRLAFQADSGASGLDVQASYDPVTKRYYLLSVNNTTTGLALTANFSAWNIPTNNQVMLEEVSESSYGAGKLWTNIGAAQSITATQGSNSVWLFTVPSQPQSPLQTLAASDDAQVNDGTNSGVNFGTNASLFIANNSTNASYRSAAFLKFNISSINPTNAQLAILRLNASAANGSSLVQAYVYGITNNNWSQTNLTWASAPNLAQGIAAGTNIPNNFVVGAGVSAQLLGQLVAGATPSEKTIDVTSFLQQAPGTNVSFMLVREVHFAGDVQDNDGVSVTSTEAGTTNGPSLDLAMSVIPQVPGIASIAISGAGAVIIHLTGTPNQTYWVQTTANLAAPDWVTVSTNLAGSDGTWTYTDTLTTNSSAKFYRAVRP
jgi:hypothetical protein